MFQHVLFSLGYERTGSDHWVAFSRDLCRKLVWKGEVSNSFTRLRLTHAADSTLSLVAADRQRVTNKAFAIYTFELVSGLAYYCYDEVFE